MAGLVLIVTFSALAGTSHTIGQIIGFRAGWGLGNALFIATSLAVIVGAASGGFGGAIILYEAALGLGISLGPLIGGELGGISWRGPFFGVTVATTGASSPCWPTARSPMHLGIHELGYVFTGWGVILAVFAVFVAPRLQRRLGTARTLYISLLLLAADLVVIAAFTSSRAVLVVAVIVSGAFIGLNNTLTTRAVMLIAPVERPVASAAYGFVRFIGGGLAPYVAARMAASLNVHVPFYVGAASVLLRIGVLATAHRQVSAAERNMIAADGPGTGTAAGVPAGGPEPQILSSGGADVPA